MNSKKILSILLGIVGIASIALLMVIISTGDESIKAGEASSTVNLFMYVAYIVLLLTLVFVVVFTLKNMFANKHTLKNTLMSVGAFIVLAVVCYFLATGVETPLKDGDTLSANGSQLIGGGLYLFYVLILIAGGIMLVSGVKKMTK
ncbi:hypothetical protein [Changchengzhania lutea]|uniref:hypothetical protein n=1 Tax=Changchengzhania lutea TaxID=2049305 RepID=UPI00163D461E|nr:hypothetical protein [Changchengzhania lutea]